MQNVTKFFGQVKTEMKKVSWPSREELISSTIVVLVSTLFLSIFIGICDFIFSRVINVLIRGVF